MSSELKKPRTARWHDDNEASRRRAAMADMVRRFVVAFVFGIAITMQTAMVCFSKLAAPLRPLTAQVPGSRLLLMTAVRNGGHRRAILPGLRVNTSER